MSDQIASVDAGNGGTNAVLARSGGNHKIFYEPSVRAAASGETLGLGKEWEMDYDYVDWNGHRYVTGDDVIRVTRRALERHMGINRYGNEFHQFLVALALAKLGVKDGTVDLTLFAPPGLYNQLKTHIEHAFMSDKGTVTIRMKGDKKPRQWRYEHVTVWPEGIGAAACFVLDDRGKVAPSDVLNGEVVILDLGAHTLDALKLVNGNFNAESLQHATWEAGGVHVHVREPILRAVKKQGDDFANLTVDDVDLVIRAGLVSEDYSLRVAGYEIDLKPMMDKYRERYAEWIANNIGDGVFDGFRGIKSVILVGGGAVLVEDYLKKWYGDKILDRKKHETTKKLHPVDMNAIGGIRFALARLKKASPA
jgi:Actin like proteins N terminal domain/Archaeal actin homologue MreB-like, C-terminal